MKGVPAHVRGSERGDLWGLFKPNHSVILSLWFKVCYIGEGLKWWRCTPNKKMLFWVGVLSCHQLIWDFELSHSDPAAVGHRAPVMCFPLTAGVVGLGCAAEGSRTWEGDCGCFPKKGELLHTLPRCHVRQRAMLQPSITELWGIGCANTLRQLGVWDLA